MPNINMAYIKRRVKVAVVATSLLAIGESVVGRHMPLVDPQIRLWSPAI
jgi:hypothetical protein